MLKVIYLVLLGVMLSACQPEEDPSILHQENNAQYQALDINNYDFTSTITLQVNVFGLQTPVLDGPVQAAVKVENKQFLTLKTTDQEGVLPFYIEINSIDNSEIKVFQGSNNIDPNQPSEPLEIASFVDNGSSNSSFAQVSSFLEAMYTVDGLFSSIQNAYDGNTLDVEVSAYDTQHYYPVSTSVALSTSTAFAFLCEGIITQYLNANVQNICANPVIKFFVSLIPARSYLTINIDEFKPN